MFKCYEGHLFDEPKRFEEEHGEFVYECPECCDCFEEAKRCKICGEWCRENDELYDGVCETCLHDYDYDWQTCVRFAEREEVKKEIEINSVLAHLYQPDEIERILAEDLQKTTNPCTGSETEQKIIRSRTDCSEFINEDPYWFADMLLDEEKKKCSTTNIQRKNTK